MGFTATAVFLHLNGYWFFAPTVEVVQNCIAIAQGASLVNQREIGRWIRARSMKFSKLRTLPEGEMAELLPAVRETLDLIQAIEEGISLPEWETSP